MANESNHETGKSRGGGLKTILIVIVVMVIEGAAIIGTMYFTGGPAEAQGGDIDPAKAQADKPVELLVLEHKFDNRMAGVPYLYDTEVYITTRQANAEQMKQAIENNRAGITVDLGAVFRRAEPAVFQEPTYATLSRQIKAVLDKRFGKDDTGEPIVQDVLILKCIGYRAEG